MLCIASGGTIMALAVSSFTLSWTHSVEKTLWQEHWVAEAQTLKLVKASVEGPGAGIAVPRDAVRTEGRWTYRPHLPALPELVLAASGATASPWTLCLADGTCHILGAQAGEPLRLWAAARCDAR